MRANWIRSTWVDSARSPQNPPDPRFPHGIDIPCQHPEQPNCRLQLPYPAKRIGHHVVECERCKQVVLVTTAGRSDDPRSVTLNCNMKGLQ
jgi:hypothetical protein